MTLTINSVSFGTLGCWDGVFFGVSFFFFFCGGGNWLFFVQLFYVEFSLFAFLIFFFFAGVFNICIAAASKSIIRT